MLEHLGPRVAVYTVPDPGQPAHERRSSGFASGLVHVPKTPSLIEVRDRDAFAEVARRAWSPRRTRPLRAQAAPGQKADGLGFLPLKGDARGYVARFPPAMLPVPAGMQADDDPGQEVSS